MSHYEIITNYGVGNVKEDGYTKEMVGLGIFIMDKLLHTHAPSILSGDIKDISFDLLYVRMRGILEISGLEGRLQIQLIGNRYLLYSRSEHYSFVEDMADEDK
jgi:hypothetical protein